MKPASLYESMPYSRITALEQYKYALARREAEAKAAKEAKESK